MAVISSYTISSQTSGWQGFAERKQHLNGNSVAGNQIRVTFVSGTVSGLKADHCSIGILGAATAPSMASSDQTGATQPVELTFNGGNHGFTIGTNQSIVSDWVNLSFRSTDTFVTDIDVNNGVASDTVFGTSVDGTASFSKATTADYNNATVAGYSTGGTSEIFVSLIEGQTVPSDPRPMQMNPILAQ
jgi:hypothetical protein